MTETSPEGFELLKLYHIEVAMNDDTFELNWTTNHGPEWFVRPIVAKLCPIKSVTKHSIESTDAYKAEVAKYKAMVKHKNKTKTALRLNVLVALRKWVLR